MANHEAQYNSVRENLKSSELQPKTLLPVNLKSGETLRNIIPYTMREKTIDGVRTYMLYYLDSDGKAGKVDMKELKGIDVVEGTKQGDGDEYEGALLIRFHYYKPHKDPSQNALESSPREIIVTGIYSGVHKNHQADGELQDFYFVGEDRQYWRNQKAERERNFPLWRIAGLYDDDPKELQALFLSYCD